MVKKANKPKTLHLFNEKKQLFVQIMHKKLGNVTESIKEMGITRQTVNEWKNNCPEFVEALKNVKEMCKDVAENTVLTSIKAGDVKAAQYYLDRQAKDRDYGEAKKVEYSVGNLDSMKEILEDAIKAAESYC